MQNQALAWAVPVMRAGYAGRGLVYCVVAGFSLFAIWQGGQAKGTSSALQQLESSLWGSIVLFLIFAGLVSYAIWRFCDSIFDLDDHGTDAKGVVARVNMFIIGLLNLGLGLTAFLLLFTARGDGGGSSTTGAINAVLGLPGGRLIVGAAGLVIIAAGIHYAYRGWTEKYRGCLQANHFTTHWNWALKAGLTAKGAVVGIIGLLVVYAALRSSPDEAGGVGEAFSWLTGQPYGRILVAAICLGLLGFALYCFVNAAYRIVPKVASPDIETLASRLETTVRQAI
ncbi:DUF1206 domain-containing protein [Microbaculum marinum]|uniref:DUF1206 domain-containing protein n=1 Tax=Microbaculum marinum TaxID=1764581 RepID=A0AAW9S1G1_9HYPH